MCVLLLTISLFDWLHLFLQENPSEEDAAIVDKVLSMRIVKKEVRPNTMLAHNATVTDFM